MIARLLIGTLMLLLAWPFAAQASVAIDAVGPAGGAGAGTSVSLGLTSPLTFTHTVTGSQTVLYIGVVAGIVSFGAHPAGNQDSDFVITGVTYNGVAATQVGSNLHPNGGTTGYLALYRLVNPSTGTNTVSISFTLANPASSDAVSAGSVSFTGVDPVTPESNLASATGTGTGPAVTVSSAVGNLVLNLLATGTSVTSSANTLQWSKNINSTSSAGNGAMATAAGSGSVPMSYVVGSDSWALLGLSINQYVPPSGTPRSVTISWVPDTEPDLAGYHLYRFTGACASLGTWVLVQTFGLVSSGTDTVPDYGVYCYSIAAFDTTGNESAKSTPQEFVYAPTAPVNPLRFGTHSMGFNR